MSENTTEREERLSQLMDILDNALVQIQEKNKYFDKARFDLYQGSILKQLFENYLDDTHSILVAPTGSGKSLISLLYTYCVSVLNDNSSCTILATDTFLQNQYIESNDFFTTHIKDSTFAMLKGKGQYTCLQTNTPYPQGLCGKRKISPKVAYDKFTEGKGFECVASCNYVKSYISAMESNIRVFNYHLFLSYANFVGEHILLSGNPTVVFDECHKIDDILDGFANTVIGVGFTKSIGAMRQTLEMMKPELVEKFNGIASGVIDKFKQLYTSVIRGDSSENMLNCYLSMCDEIKKFNDRKDGVYFFDDNGYESFDDSKTLYRFMADIIASYQKKVDSNVEIPFTIQAVFDFDEFVSKASFLYYDASGISADKFVINYDATTKNITIANISTKDRFQSLIRNHLSCPMVFMSATVGNAEYYADYLGLKPDEFRIIDVASMFDFSKSPIIPVLPLISMANSKIDDNLSKMMFRIDSILDVHHDHNGIIHTANKKIANYIVANTKHKNRVITYQNAQEKRDSIERLTKDSNYVIVAYSMEEGVDFKDELGRFQIIAKLSWAYLGDYIVKRKMELYPKWYEMTTLNKLLQTFGRTNRHIKDYSITYILDTSFGRLVESMDGITKSRIKNKFYDEVTREMVEETFGIKKIDYSV